MLIMPPVNYGINVRYVVDIFVFVLLYMCGVLCLCYQCIWCIYIHCMCKR